MYILLIIYSQDSSKNIVEIEFAAILDGHRDAVTCIKTSSSWSVVISGSKDHTCIIWDLNRLQFVRSLRDHHGPIVAVDIHKYSVFHNHYNSLIFNNRAILLFLILLVLELERFTCGQ